MQKNIIIAGSIIGALILTGIGYYFLQPEPEPALGATGVHKNSDPEALKEYLKKERGMEFVESVQTTHDVAKQAGFLQEIDGGFWFNTSTALPFCDDSIRGLLWFSRGGEGEADSMLFCGRDASGKYDWHTM